MLKKLDSFYLGSATETSGSGEPGAVTSVNNKTGDVTIGINDILTTAQKNAANSGITSAKVSTYDGYATTIAGKQDTLSTAQLNAVNSGITSSKVSKYDGYESDIDSKADADDSVLTGTTNAENIIVSGDLTGDDCQVNDLVVANSISVPTATTDDEAVNLGMAKISASNLRVYLDNVNGSDNNDGLTQAHPLKTIEGLFTKYPLASSLIINFLSDYTGNINLQDKSIQYLTLQSSNVANHPKIKGKLTLPTGASVTIMVLDVEFTYNGEGGPDGAIDCNSNTLTLQISDIKVKNASATANKGCGIRMSQCVFSILANTTISVADDTVSSCKNAIDILYSNGYVATNTATGFTRVCNLTHGAQLRTTSDFISNSSCTSGTAETDKIVLATGSMYAKDGIWQRQE